MTGSNDPQHDSYELLRAQGIVRDVEAAANCLCSCHPSTKTLHDGGATCPCQLTAEERAARFEAAISELSSYQQDPEFLRRRAERDAAFDAAARELGVQIDSHGGMAPYVICGVVDGRAFYLRERHESWSVVVAPERDPLVNPWGDRNVDGEVVAEGFADWTSDDYEIEALQVAVRSVRTALVRQRCTHQGAAFCSGCGIELDERWWRTEVRP